MRSVQSFFQGTYGSCRRSSGPAGGRWLATSDGGDKDSSPNDSDNRILHVEPDD